MGAEASFNLWSEPCIPVVRPDGGIEEIGIHEALARAHELASLHETSPALVAGMHRLLTAIVQACYAPAKLEDISGILKVGRFDEGLLQQFGERHGDRFDLISSTTPFLQTGDVSLTPEKQDKAVSVGYLVPDEPTGTNVAHFKHRYETEHRFCLPCAARALVALPAFATAAGRGFRPSINGVPPLYVLPAGKTLFEALTLSLVSERFRPEVAAPDTQDQPWWERSAIIPAGEEVQRVGYLESLTFPARRVRFFPQIAAAGALFHCTRCGRSCEISVAQMHFGMGLSRPKEAEPWLDPFAAYRVRENKRPIPVRLVEGRPLWREFATLFVTHGDVRVAGTAPPRVVEQLGALEGRGDTGSQGRFAFRCIGLRTDMKAKVFEWDDVTLELPAGFLNDPAAQQRLTASLGAAEDGWGVLSTVFALWLASPRPGEAARQARKRHDDLRRRLRDTYWQLLASPFRDVTLQLVDATRREPAFQRWLVRVRSTGVRALREAATGVGEDADALRRSVHAVDECGRKLYSVIRRHGYEPPQTGTGAPAAAA